QPADPDRELDWNRRAAQPRLAHQALGLGDIVFVGRERLIIAGSEIGQRALHLRAVAVEYVRDDGLDRDRVIDGLPNLDIIERRLLAVHAEPMAGRVLDAEDLQPGLALQALHALRREAGAARHQI